MSAELVNLRMARKTRARGDAQALAAANRAKFGEAGADRKARRAEATRADRALAGAKREPD